MTEKVFVVALLMVAIVLGMLIGLNVNQKLYLENKGEMSVSLSTDKDSYKEGDPIEVSVFVYSTTSAEVVVNVSGITSRFGHNYISLEKNASLKPGRNEINFSSRAPYCSSCAGIYPGTYSIAVSILKESEIIATATKNISIEKR